MSTVILFSGCASQITSIQKSELESFRSKGEYVEVKSTATATGLGLLPGGGSFYTENYGLGVVNLLLWPISVLWDPINGHNGAEMINYHATKQNMKLKKKQELTLLERDLEDNKIDQKHYVTKKREIEDHYSSEI